jgi:hypothetical protein
MDNVEVIALVIGGGVIVAAVLAVFVLPALGGDRQKGRDESDYWSNTSGGGSAGGD